MGRQWFALTMRDPGERWRGVTQARPTLDAFLDEELKRHQLDASRLALVGFSQGTMMALHVGLRRAKQLAGIVGFSGALSGAEELKTEIKTRPPVLLAHGGTTVVGSAVPSSSGGHGLAVSGRHGFPPGALELP